MTVLLGVIVKIGVVLTEIVRTALSVQELAAVPVKVYVVVIVGLTAYAAVKGPPDHVYVIAPLPVSVLENPEQIDELVAEIVIVGAVLTEITSTAVFVQPVIVPVTV